MTRLDEVIGRKFGRLQVVDVDRKRFVAICLCDCGQVRTPKPMALLSGRQVSCGCHRAELSRMQRNETLADVLAGCTVGASDECWPWQRALGSHGYGQINFRGTQMTAHRAAFIASGGVLEPGQLACHRCDNRPCINPAHIFAGSYQDNVDDMMAKGRAPVIVRPKGFLRMHCQRGHILAETQYVRKDGSRLCGVCMRERQRKWERSRSVRVVQPLR